MTPLRVLLAFAFLGTRRFFFFGNRLRELVTSFAAWIMTKFEQLSRERFGNILELRFKFQSE